MKSIIKIIKGGLIGIGNILPGISGSMIAVILNIYEDLITALNQLFTHPIQAIKSVWPYVVGVVIGIFVGSKGVNVLYGIAPLPITILFIGFIIGAIPTLYKQIKGMKFEWHHILVFVVAALVMLSVLFIKENPNAVHGFWYHVSVVFVGFIYAIAMIIPGLSGATMLMAFGFFYIFTDLLDVISAAVVTLDFSAITSQILIVFLLILGAFIGLIIMGRVMAVFMKKYHQHFIVAVLGIVIVSPINILVLLQRDSATNVYDKPWYIYLISLIALAAGIFFTLKLAKGNNKEIEGEDLND